MRPLVFDTPFVRELPGDNGDPVQPRTVHGAAWSHARPTPVRHPVVLSTSAPVAAALGLNDDDVASPTFRAAFAGNLVVPGMTPWAACYGGHQFGNWAGQLGDGRAMSLGALLAPDGTRHELQLKGAGPTPYSRRADGRAVLRSSLREYVCSEAMHHLGIPTTRALSLIATGDDVVRDMLYDGHPAKEPGAIVCRTAPTFVRFGSFELPASRNDTALLTTLVDHTIAHHFPGLAALAPAERRAAMFTIVCERTADLMAHWMRVGFVHGVMNTDNMSILGLTIDYGPYGFLDAYDPDWTPNTTDAEGRRYRYGHQPQVALWNLTRLAESLLPLVDEQALQRGLDAYETRSQQASRQTMAAKLGLGALHTATKKADAADNDTDADDDDRLVADLLALLAREQLDMTVFFRRLADVDLRHDAHAAVEPLRASFTRADGHEGTAAACGAWLERYLGRARRDVPDGLDRADAHRVERAARMNAVNPALVFRNCLAQQAIDDATAGDTTMLAELLDTLRRPYEEPTGSRARFAALAPPWAKTRVGCAMLSCSS